MSRHRAALPSRARQVTAVLSMVCFASTILFAFGLVRSGQAVAAGGSDNVTRTEKIARTNLIDGKNVVADQRTVTVTANGLQNLHDREGVDISWTGAHPTGDIYYDPNSENAGYAEYPVVILQCRGVDSSSVPARQRLSPQTCFTQTPNTRYQPPFSRYGLFPPYRLDRYAAAADRAQSVGAPTPRPASCPDPRFGAERWMPFVAANGTVYHGGQLGCGGLAPEQSVTQNPLIPPNSVFGTSDLSGAGSARFIVQDATDNASLGCSAGVACSIVVIPIMGISCDAAATALPASDRPLDVATAQSNCTDSGFYRPGDPASDQKSADPNSSTAVNGLLWWSASNWRNRITLPITMAPTASSCDVTGGGAPTNIYGSEYMVQATQQWAPTFCQDPHLFRLQHTQTSEVEAKNLLATSVTNGHYLGVKAAFQAGPPQTPFSNPIAQVPTALSGWGIGYVIDDAHQHEYTQLRLDARLLAKLMTMSYPAFNGIRQDWSNDPNYAAAKNNPLDMSSDPEFLALNPGAKTSFINQFESSATLYMMSSDSDVMTALTSYINADPEARAWLDGKPDPWGMVVNPNYKGIKLPVTAWPQLDTLYDPLGNNCIADSHAPFLPLIQAPVADPSQITFNLQLGIANSQTNCTIYGTSDSPGQRRLTAVGREQPGIRFIVGLVSVADARRYRINLAALQTHNDNPSSTAQFTDATGRTFVTPTDQSMLAAGRLMTPDDRLGTWPMPYSKLNSTSAGASAYPGTLLMSTDVPTAGLLAPDATNYAKFLTYVGGPGSVPGADNGQLAAGYVPLDQADGLGAMHQYLLASARAVQEQHGVVPTPSDPVVPTDSTSAASSSTPGAPRHPTAVPVPAGGAPAPGGGGNPVTNGGVPVAGAPAGGGVTSSAAATRTATTGAGPAPSISASPVASVPTPDTKPGWAGQALPALAIIALASGALAAWTSGVGRR